MVDSIQEARRRTRRGRDWHVDRLLRPVGIPAQGAVDDDGALQMATQRAGQLVAQSADERASEADHDHAWRRHRTQRGETFAEYRCDLCALSYLE
jgi:hypothetical protein